MDNSVTLENKGGFQHIEDIPDYTILKSQEPQVSSMVAEDEPDNDADIVVPGF